MVTRREDALALADELLADYELSRIPRAQWIAKVGRLARLLDDADAMAWLRYETVGYPKGSLDRSSARAAGRSNRHSEESEDGEQSFLTASVAQLEASIEASRVQLAAASDPDVSISSANPGQYVMGPVNNQRERGLLRNYIGDTAALINAVCGSVFDYVNATYYELRFGAAAESAFETVRTQVDATVARLVPDAVQMLAAAFESVASDNPEHWANAAATCRRLLKAVADALQPPGPDVGGRKMGNDQYTNRLAYWIEQHQPSTTMGDVTKTELDHLGERIDAIQDAGHKGTHDTVTKEQAARILTGTYLLVGDILALAPSAVESAMERMFGDAMAGVDVDAVVNDVKYNINEAQEGG